MYNFDIIKITEHVSDIDKRIAFIAEAIAIAEETEGRTPGEYSVAATLRSDLAKLKIKKLVFDHVGKPPKRKKPVRKVVSDDEDVYG
jgi:hypothetical protein